MSIGGTNSLIVSISVMIVTIAVSLCLNAINPMNIIYYRPHEMFTIYDHDAGHWRYKQDIDCKIEMPYGDLHAVAPKYVKSIEPREMLFQTDSLGFRNCHDYHGQKYILVGDSFLVGNGTTQGEILTEQLRNRYGIDTYNLSHSGNIKDYSKYVDTFDSINGDNKYSLLLFLYEGNDFPVEKAVRYSATPTFMEKVRQVLMNYRHRLVSNTNVYRYTFSAIADLRQRILLKKESRVIVQNVAGHSIAFYLSNIDVTRRDGIPENDETERYIGEMKDKIRHIFFIPTKYRVYSKFVNKFGLKGRSKLPNRQWEYVQKLGAKFDISVTNLTPEIMEESINLLQHGLFTYWRDDTHWNSHGIAVAARAVDKILNGH